MKRAIQITGAILSVGVALASARYLFTDSVIPPNIFQNLFRTPWLMIHIVAATLALLVGPFQFLGQLRRQRPALHRWVGRLYVGGCIVGGAAGLVLAAGASTGPISTAGFGVLAILWIITTSLALRTAMQRRFIDHRAWMIRSFALTLAAVTLRLYLPLTFMLQLDFDTSYRAISWLCWVPNILVAEYILRRSGTRQLAPA